MVLWVKMQMDGFPPLAMAARAAMARAVLVPGLAQPEATVVQAVHAEPVARVLRVLAQGKTAPTA